MTFEDFIAKFPQAKQNGRNFMVRCPAHEDRTASLSVAKGRNGVVLKCFAGCETKAVCGALGIHIADLFFDAPGRDFTVKYKPLPEADEAPLESKLVAEYSYRDSLGREVYQALRFEPKDFRQRRPNGSGGWIYNMDSVERVLYNLPAVLKSPVVWVVEGEKDADNLAKQGICATTNVGGAKKWLDGYSDCLKGKDVVICGDNDKPGQEHAEQVFESIANKAKSVRMIRLPSSVKDISDYIVSLNGNSDKAMRELVEATVPCYGGIKLPIYTMEEIEPKYIHLVRNTATMRLDLSKWIPSLRTRPIIPGELVLFVGDTATGKTAVLQNIAFRFRDLKPLLFEMELPSELLFERFVAMKSHIACSEVEKMYVTEDGTLGPVLKSGFKDLFICPEPRLTPERLEQLIVKSDLKMGCKPVLVIVDYVQLMLGAGNTRYERASNVAESLKEIAKVTQTIVVCCSQIPRPEDRNARVQPNLHSAKDSGSFESSAGLVIGIDRDPKDVTALGLRVLKSTKGGAGQFIMCNFDGATMTITERAKTNEHD